MKFNMRRLARWFSPARHPIRLLGIVIVIFVIFSNVQFREAIMNATMTAGMIFGGIILLISIVKWIIRNLFRM